MHSSGEFDAFAARKKLKGVVQYTEERITRYPFKPFDARLAYLDPELQPLFSRPSPDLLTHRGVAGNAFLISRDTADKHPEGPPFYFSTLVCDYDSISGHARHFPIRLQPLSLKKKTKGVHQAELAEGIGADTAEPMANLSPRARAYLAKLVMNDPDTDAEAAALLWMHVLAIGYSPAYLNENGDGIRNGWPRIPLPRFTEVLLASYWLGCQVAALLNTEGTVPGVTAGTIRPELTTIAVVSRVSGGPLDPQGGDLALTAGWGHAGQSGVVMPGTGRLVEREYTAAERAAIEDGSRALGLSSEQAFLRLGTTTFDIHLNELAFWANVPAKVWAYTIGGYQVIKKWLSYRERDLLGRDLTSAEVREVRDIARRIAALVLLETQLDANYKAVSADTYEWGPEETAG
jgi:hypothetical protein